MAYLQDEVRIRTESEAHLRESEERYRTLFDNSIVGVFRCTPDGRLLLANTILANMLGYESAAELQERSLTDHFPMDTAHDSPSRKPSFELSHLNGGEHCLRRCDGTSLPVALHARLMVDENGTPLGYEGLVLDITARKQAEETLRRHREQLTHVTWLASLSETLAAIAHEVNQPLNAIAGFAGASVRTVLECTDPAVVQVRQWNERIADEASRAGEIIRRLRGLAHLDSPRLAPVGWRELVRSVLAITQPLLEALSVEIELEHDSAVSDVLVERLLIEQVLINLIRNACEAMNDTPASRRKITIQAIRNERFVQISVSDTGTGISSADGPRIFEPFVTTKVDGIGLGLAISRSIIESHGGQIWTEMKAGPGATFCFALPLAMEQMHH